MKTTYIYLKGYNMKEYCLIEIPEHVSMDEFNQFLNLWLTVMKNSRRFMKLNKAQKELLADLDSSIKNSNIGTGNEILNLIK